MHLHLGNIRRCYEYMMCECVNETFSGVTDVSDSRSSKLIDYEIDE